MQGDAYSAYINYRPLIWGGSKVKKKRTARGRNLLINIHEGRVLRFLITLGSIFLFNAQFYLTHIYWIVRLCRGLCSVSSSHYSLCIHQGIAKWTSSLEGGSRPTPRPPLATGLNYIHCNEALITLHYRAFGNIWILSSYAHPPTLNRRQGASVQMYGVRNLLTACWRLEVIAK